LCYEAIYWIAGGLPKAAGSPRSRPIRTGAARLSDRHREEEFAATLGSSVPFTRCGDLATAVTAAAEAAAPRPGQGRCRAAVAGLRSYDQFAHFEARGDAFAKWSRR